MTHVTISKVSALVGLILFSTKIKQTMNNSNWTF